MKREFKMIQKLVHEMKFMHVIVAMTLLSTAAFAKTRVNLTLGLTNEKAVPNMPAAIGDEAPYNKDIVRISVARTLPDRTE
jgi:hypothetical protein